MTIEACAKVNLTLKVTGVRADGFHELESIVQPIGLCDELSVETAADGIYETDSGFADDLCLKAARLLVRGCRVRIVKRIPVGGGLGGGSADAAAVLRALNELCMLGHTPEKLAEIGAAVGSDVPALVLAQHYRRPVMMTGRGEWVRLATAAELETLGFATSGSKLVLFNPGIHSSTPEVYRKFDELKANGLNLAGYANQLEPAALSLHPEIAAALKHLRELGLEHVMMSGSGSTVFGFLREGCTLPALPGLLVCDL